MATILLHAGMPKAGSSAIQRWLESLRDQPVPDFTPAVARIRSTGVSVEAHTGGNCNSGIVVEEMRRAGNDSRNVIQQFTAELDKLASQHSYIALSGEALCQPFWQKDMAFLSALNDLGQSYDVVVLYYVRPQDTALEAAWRQWGFRTGFSPENYVRHRAIQMNYLDTLVSTAEAAPNIDFRMRPFRRDLLAGGDVVVDFAQHGPGLSLPGARGLWDSNLGLPLDVVNLLAQAPPGLLGNSPHENQHFAKIKTALSDIDIPASSNAAEGRAILHAWAYETFEEENQRLIHQLRWHTDRFIRPRPEVEGDLSLLNDCWRAQAVDAELAAFFGLVKHLIPSSGRRMELAGGHPDSQQLAQLQSKLFAEERRRVSAEQKLNALLSRRAVKVALRGSDYIGKILHRR